MYVKQIYTGCLSEAAYFIESDGQAAVIDPLRDIDSYIELAKEHNATIKYIFETHFHADFVSGHIDLGKQTNAPIIYGYCFHLWLGLSVIISEQKGGGCCYGHWVTIPDFGILFLA